MSAKARILVVEDEEPIRVGVCDLLAYHGHDPVAAADGTQGLRAALDDTFDLLVLDVMLPEVDGFTICRRARDRHPGRAILMMTARGKEDDVLEGFNAGCDDYVTKPFSVAVLIARVEALLRRSGTARSEKLQIGPVAIDLDNFGAEGSAGSVELTVREAGVMRHLSQNAHRVVSRAELLREVWGYERADALETRCVDMHLVKLRRKLEEVAPGSSSLIETVRGAGYRLRS